MVVPVFMTSCHVSLYWNIGPVIPHRSIIATARMKAEGRPVLRAVNFANFVNQAVDFVGLIKFASQYNKVSLADSIATSHGKSQTQ